MIAALALLTVLAAAPTAFAADGLPPLVGDGLKIVKEICPRLEEEPNEVQSKLEKDGWAVAGNWIKEGLIDVRGWVNRADTISISMDSYHFKDGLFFQCRVSILTPGIEFDPTAIGTEFDVSDGITIKRDGRVAGHWQLRDKDFVALNAIFDGRYVHLIKMRTASRAGEDAK
jgi:hypothetical protein